MDGVVKRRFKMKIKNGDLKVVSTSYNIPVKYIYVQ